jgi:diguanylate cyclase (GGDEF)-like protein
VIRGREAAVCDVVAAHVARGDTSIWDGFGRHDIVNADVDRLPDDVRAAMQADGTVQLIAIRVDAGGRTLFVMLCFMRDPNAGGLLGNTRLAVEQLRDAVTQAIERDEGRRALEEAASRDPLTGLYNRSGFDRVSAGVSADSSIIYVDLDGFKSVNDTHGHAVGDAVLAEVASRLRSACRPHDRIARLGGDEFAIVIDAADDDVEAVARRLLATIALPLPAHLGPRSISASIGIARLAEDDDLSDSITAADLAMLAAKRAGRGRIVSA